MNRIRKRYVYIRLHIRKSMGAFLQEENIYEVRVKVKTLAEVSELLQLLDKVGYKDVEMGAPRPLFLMEGRRKFTEVAKGRFNKLILRALHELGATDREHAIEIRKIIQQMGKNSEFKDLLQAHHARLQCTSKGILARTVAMITSAILADKYGWVQYDATQAPKKFWLTKRGLEQKIYEET